MSEPVYQRPSDAPAPEPKPKRTVGRHTAERRKRRMAELKDLRAGNELLHRRLAAVYDALSLE